MSSFDAASTLDATPPPARGVVWTFVVDPFSIPRDIGVAFCKANRPSGFGVDAVKYAPENAFGAVYVGPRTRNIHPESAAELEAFFTRDGEAEANVFEFDPVYNKFRRLTLSDVTTRKYL